MSSSWASAPPACARIVCGPNPLLQTWSILPLCPSSSQKLLPQKLHSHAAAAPTSTCPHPRASLCLGPGGAAAVPALPPHPPPRSWSPSGTSFTQLPSVTEVCRSTPATARPHQPHAGSLHPLAEEGGTGGPPGPERGSAGER